MKSALLSFTMLLLLLAPPAHGRAPELNVKAICEARAADTKALQSIPEQTVAECIHDEENQKQKLNAIWASTAVRIRNLCASDARALGTTSYLDLVTCIQMTVDLQASRQKQAGKQ
jgi:hypothetical protein